MIYTFIFLLFNLKTFFVYEKALSSSIERISLSYIWLFATPGFSVSGILQTTILEWVAFPFSRGSFQPRDRTQVSLTAGWCFYPAEVQWGSKQRAKICRQLETPCRWSEGAQGAWLQGHPEAWEAAKPCTWAGWGWSLPRERVKYDLGDEKF